MKVLNWAWSISIGEKKETLDVKGNVKKELTQYTNWLDKGLLEEEGREKDGSEERQKMALKIPGSKTERVLYYLDFWEKTFRWLKKSVNKNQIIGLKARG